MTWRPGNVKPSLEDLVVVFERDRGRYVVRSNRFLISRNGMVFVESFTRPPQGTGYWANEQIPDGWMPLPAALMEPMSEGSGTPRP